MKQSDWLYQHSGSGHGMCDSDQTVFFANNLAHKTSYIGMCNKEREYTLGHMQPQSSVQ